MVDKQIKQLLHHHDCVVIPEFGGLIARYVSARIHPVKHMLAPPSKMIAFNEKLILNDGLLISAIAHNKGISQQEAQQIVAAFVHEAKEKLRTENRFMLQDIGIFRYNAAQKLEFEFVESENLLDASFGLPEIISRPIKPEDPAVLRTLIKERQPQVPAPKQPLRKRLKRVYNITTGLFLGGLTVSAIYLLSLQTDYNLSSLNPISLFEIGGNKVSLNTYSRYTADFVPLTRAERADKYQEVLPFTKQEELQETEPALWHSFAANLTSADINADSAANINVVEELTPIEAPEELVKEEVKPVVVKPAVTVAKPAAAESKPAAAVKKPAAEQETNSETFTIKGKTGRCYIIAGSYSTLKNAEESRQQIRKKGYEAFIILPEGGSKLYKVAIASFATEAEAHAVKKDFRKIFGETIWVLKN